MNDWKSEDVQIVDHDNEEEHEEEIFESIEDESEKKQYDEVKSVTYKDSIEKIEGVRFSLSKSSKKAHYYLWCNKSVVGNLWFKEFLLLLTSEERRSIKRRRENRFCRFGNGV